MLSLRSFLALLSVCTVALGQQAVRPNLTKTAGSPIAIGTDGALNAVGGFDFTGDGDEDLLTIGFGPNGTSEVRINPGNGSGGFATGGTASLGQVAVSVSEDNLAAGYLYPPEALGGDPMPAVAAIGGGALRLFKSGFSPLGTLSEQTAPTFAASLRSVAIGDLDDDGRDDIVVTGGITTPTTRGAVYVILNGAGGLGAPVELSQPGAEAGKLALGDVNGDGLVDIVVCNPADKCAKIYLATAPGTFGSAPVTVDTAGGTFDDTRPQAVAIGDLLPSAGQEMVFWNTCGDTGDPQRIIQFAILKHTGGGIFERDAGLGFSEHPAASDKIGDIALGDFNGDGQLDIVGTDPVRQDGGLAVVPVKLFNGSFDFANSPMFELETTTTPDNIAVGNANGDLFSGGSRPRLDVFITHVGVDDTRTMDVFLNSDSSTPPGPPGTPVITTTEWPQLGGELTATGATGPLRYAAIVNGRTSSELPSGQRISSLGEVIGVAANGTHTVTVRVSAGKKFSEKTFTFTVNNVAELAQGPVAWWPGEDAGADVVGGHTALALSAPAYAAGKVGRAFSFDGVDDFVYANDTGGPLDLRTNLTIEGWVKPSADAKGVRTIVAKHDSADEDLTFALQVEKNGDLSFITQRAADRRPVTVTSIASVPVGEWTHVAARVRGVEISLFINGRLDITKSMAPAFLPPSTAGQAVTIGATCTSPTGARANFWKGEIDELTLYRRALEDIEVDLVAKVGSAGKFRYDASAEFVTTAPQPGGALWRYGSMAFGTYNPANFTPFPTLDTTSPALDVWKTAAANGPEVRRNRLTTTHSTGSGASEIRYAPGQVAQRTGTDGSYSIVRWTAPEAGRYAVGATWQCINAAGTSTGVRIYHNANSITSGTGPNQFLGSQSFTGTVTVAAGDTIDFWLQQNFVLDDSTGLFASVVPLPEEYVPVKTPEIDDIDFDLPLQTGKNWSFRARQEGGDDHVGRIGLKLQYSATPGVPGSWQDVPEGAFTKVGSVGWRLNTTLLPVGNFAFRVATSVTGEETVFSDPSQLFNIGAATTILDFISREQEVASDPTGATTHRGDVITYRFVVRNAGGLAQRGVSLRAIIPDGTKVLAKTKGGKLRKKPGLSGPPLSYMVWSLGEFEPTPLDDAPEFELTVKVIEPSVKQDLINPPGFVIRQNDYALFTGDFMNPGDFEFGPMPFLSATIVNPIGITAVADDLTPDQGGLVTFDITVKNQSSYDAKRVQVEAALPVGMFLPVNVEAVKFLNASGAPSEPPVDPATRKLAKFKKGENPQRDLESRADGKMAGLFYIGTLPAGATQKVRVVGQVQYGYFNNIVADVPRIRAEDFAATWTSTAARLITAKAAPIDLSVNVVPTAARPALGFAMSQIGAGEVVKPDTTEANSQRIVAVTTKGYPVTASLPKRDSNVIHYTATFSNTGARTANFVNAHLSIPAGTSYKNGSMKLNGVAVKPVAGEFGGVELRSLPLPPLAANGSAHVIEYDVIVDRNLAIGTTIEQGGGFLTSRDIYYILGLQLALTSLKAEVVQPAIMDYYAYGQDVPPTGNEVKQFISYTNKGGLAAEGVNIEYTIPPGLTYLGADYVDTVTVPANVASRRTIEAPNVGQRGIVRFKVGTVEPARLVKGKVQGGGGFVRVRCAVDVANIQQGAVNDPNLAEAVWTLDHVVRGYEVTPASAPGEQTRGTGEIRPGDIRYAFRTQAQRTPAGSGLAKTFVAMLAPASMLATDELQYTVIWGNVSSFSGGSGGMRVPIPDGTEYVAGSATDGISTTGNPNSDADANYNPPGDVPGLPPNGSITWIGGMAANAANIATFRVRLKPGFDGPVKANGGRSGFDVSGYRYLREITTTVRSEGVSIEAQQAQIFANAAGQAAEYVAGTENRESFVAATQQIGTQSLSITVDGADHIKVESNGLVIIPLLGGNMVAAGGGNLIGNDGSTLVAAGGGNLVAAGGGNLVKVDVGAGLITGSALYTQIPTLVAAGGLNLVNGSSGSLLEKRAGALVGPALASLIGNDGSTLVGLDGSTLGQFRLIGNDGSTFFPANGGAGIVINPPSNGLVAAGGGNLVAAGGGNIIMPGGFNLIGNDGSTLVNAGGLNLIGNDGSTLIGNDGSTLIGNDGSTLIGNDGSTLVAAGAGNLGAQTAGRMVAAGGGNIVSGSNGLRPPGQ